VAQSLVKLGHYLFFRLWKIRTGFVVGFMFEVQQAEDKLHRYFLNSDS
jgi:hypothetical protein